MEIKLLSLRSYNVKLKLKKLNKLIGLGNKSMKKLKC